MADKLNFETSASTNMDAMALNADPSTAMPDHVKSHNLYKDIVSREIKVGTMPIIPASSTKIDLDIGTEDDNHVFVIPEGYHDGHGKVYTGKLSDYTPGNTNPEDVVNNKVFWVNGKRMVGTMNVQQVEQIATATSKDIVDGATAWVGGEKITGEIPKLPRKDKTLLAGESYTSPYGLSPGTSVITAASLESQTTGDAEKSDIMEGKTGWVNGKKITGSLNVTDVIKDRLSDTDALQEHVIAGKKFYSSKYDTVVEGRIPDHSAEPIRTIEIGQQFAIPKGYYDGTSKITTKSLADSTVASARADTILNGRTAWINGDLVTGTMPLIESTSKELQPGETYTIEEGYHTGTGTLTTKSAAEQTAGTAVGDDILQDKVAWVNGKKIVGSMPYNVESSVEIPIGDSIYIPRGYHTGTGSVYTKPLSDYTQGTADPSKIVNGSTAWVNGVKITGTMPINEAKSVELAAGESYKVPTGFHKDSSTITTAPLTDQTPGTADASDILKGQIVWVNGKKITGTLELKGSAFPADVIAGKTFYNSDAKQIQTGMLEFNGNAKEEDVLEGVTFYSDNPKRKQSGSLKLTGSVTPDKVLANETFYTTDPKQKITGTMPNVGSVNAKLASNETFRIPKGYHDGTGFVSAEKLDNQTPGTATEQDIAKGATAWVNGEKITGNMTLEGTATPEKVAAGFTFYTSDPKQKITGTMLTMSSKIVGIDCGQEYIMPPGYYDGTSKVIGNSLESQTEANATSSDMIENTTAWVNGEKISGNIANLANKSFAEIIAGDTVTIPRGFYDGTGTIQAKDLASQTVSDATDANILDTKTAWVNGNKVTGSMPNNTGWTKDAVVCGSTIEIPMGFHDGNTTITTASLESQTEADAVAGDILAPKTAWIAGNKVTGTIPTHKTKTIRISAGNDVTIPAGYYSEGITIYSLYTDRLDLTGTDAYVKDAALYPMSTGHVENGQLVVTIDPIQ